jgi:hypothetical protein
MADMKDEDLMRDNPTNNDDTQDLDRQNDQGMTDEDMGDM